MLIEKVEGRTAVIGVIGLGYVGLPLAVEKAKAGFTVIGFDIQEQRVKMVNEGHNYIGDVVNEDLEQLAKSGKLQATTDFESLRECDVVAICVPTPLDVFKQPDLSYVIRSTEEIAKRWIAAGYQAVKFGWEPMGTSEAVDLDLVSGARRGVGDDNILLIDAGCIWDARTALRRAQKFAEYNIEWLEESTGAIRIFFMSLADTTIIVLDPEGNFICNDDSGIQGANPLDPAVLIGDPIVGTYSIWIGTYLQDELAAGYLMVTEFADTYPGHIISGMMGTIVEPE